MLLGSLSYCPCKQDDCIDKMDFENKVSGSVLNPDKLTEL